MYKYKIKGHLFDNIYLLSTLLLEHSITPVFVFDGPKHFYKQRTLERRPDLLTGRVFDPLDRQLLTACAQQLGPHSVEKDGEKKQDY